MSRLFGTDGIRGTAGTYPLDAETVARVGAALVRALPHPASGQPPRLVVGRDTRESGEWLERALARGVRSQGATLVSAGVLPTPAIAYVTRAHFDAGLVISASHNPYQDNGIKVFSGAGEKFGEALEAQIEGIVADTVVVRRQWRRCHARARRFRRRVRRSRSRGAAGSRRPRADAARSRSRQRCDDVRGAEAVPGSRFRRNSRWRRTRRAEHQSRVRLDASRTVVCAGARGGLQARRRLRRRRRSRYLRFGRRTDRRRRRRPPDVREADETGRNTRRQRPRRDRDEQHRPRAGAPRRRDRARQVRSWRQVRDGRNDPPGTASGRRAVRSRDLFRAPVYGRRHRHLAARPARDG